MGNFKAPVTLEGVVVQGAVPGPRARHLKSCAFDGGYRAGYAGFFHDGKRKIIPGADSFVAKMVRRSIRVAQVRLVQYAHHHGNDIPGVGWRPDPVGNDIDRFAFLSEAEHGLDEIFPERGVEPADPDDELRRGDLPYQILTCQLGQCIDPMRLRFCCLRIREWRQAVKYVIR